MASPGGLAEQHRDMIPRRVRGTAWHGFIFDLGAYMWEQRAHEGLERGGVFTRGGVWPSSKAESHPRGRPALERGGISPEGATSPRARRSLTRGGVQPSSEAEFYQCDAVSLERNGISPEGGWGWLFWWAVGAARSVGPCRWAVIVSGVFYVL
jgi:hypothetical protein